MKTRFFFLLSSLSLFLIVLTIACAGIPARGTPEWEKRVRSGEVLVSADDVPGTGLKVVHGTGWTLLKPAVAWEIFQDINSLHKFLYRIEKSVEYPRRGDKRIIELVVNAPPIALTSGYDRIQVKAEVTESTLDNGRVRRGDFVSIEGNIKNAYGAWEVEAAPGGGSYITFSMFIDFGKVYIPDEAANFFVKDFIERWGHDLREYAENPENRLRYQRAAAARAGRDPDEIAPSIEGALDYLR